MSHQGPHITYFLSDIHLGAKYIKDAREHEQRIVALLEEMGCDADHIYLLGDVLDYWFEYRTVVPRGYVRFFGELARLCDKGIKITWITGNHDIWMRDYLRNELGIEIIERDIVREIDGRRFYLGHGHRLGKLMPRGFRFIQSMFNNKVCRKLYASIHPRWTIPFAQRWSAGSRSNGEEAYLEWLGDDQEQSYVFAKNYLAEKNPDINYFILGHRHIGVDKMLSPTCKFIVLGDCFKQYVYARWDGSDVSLKQFDAQNAKFKLI